jgi:hypothetical protein
MYILETGIVDVAEYLTQKGADPNGKTARYSTLEKAKVFNQAEIIEEFAGELRQTMKIEILNHYFVTLCKALACIMVIGLHKKPLSRAASGLLVQVRKLLERYLCIVL